MSVRKGASADANRADHTTEEWTSIRDRAVLLGQISQGLTVEDLEAWIEQGERALGLGFIFDPTAARNGADELSKQLTYMRAVLAFRRAVAEIIGRAAAHGEEFGL